MHVELQMHCVTPALLLYKKQLFSIFPVKISTWPTGCSPISLFTASGCWRVRRTLLSNLQHFSTENRTKHSWRAKVNTPSTITVLLTVEGKEQRRYKCQNAYVWPGRLHLKVYSMIGLFNTLCSVIESQYYQMGEFTFNEAKYLISKLLFSRNQFHLCLNLNLSS